MPTADNASAPPRSRTFGSFLRCQTWESVIQLVLASQSYYHNPQAETASAPATTNETQKKAPLLQQQQQQQPCSFLRKIWHALSGYYVSASKTRLAVHAFTAAYLLHVALHPSRNVAVSVTYDPHKFMRSTPADTDSPRPAAVRFLARVLQPLIFGDAAANAKAYDYAALNSGGEAQVFVYQSREGMQLLTKEPLLFEHSRVHTLCGCLLFPLSLLQLESVFYMSHAVAKRRSQASLHAEEQRSGGVKLPQAEWQRRNDVAFEQVKNAREGHCTFGLITVAAMLTMVFGGLWLRGKSLFSGIAQLPHGRFAAYVVDFSRALVYFALPWGAFAVGLMGSAMNRVAVPHVVVGMLVPKACLAVALARTLGGLAQRLLGVHVALPPPTPSSSASSTSPSSAPTTTSSEPLSVVQAVPGELERVYYASIGTAAVLVGLWAVADTVALLRRAHEAFAEQERRKRV